MAETVIGYSVKVEIVNHIAGADGASQRVAYSKTFNFSDGTGINQLGNQWYDETRTLAGTSEDLDFGAGGLTDFQGSDVALNNIKVLLLENLSTTAAETLKLKQGSTNPVIGLLAGTAPTFTVGPGGILLAISPIDGYVVTNGTADVLATETSATSSYLALVGGDNA